jgi:hypothetical protein
MKYSVTCEMEIEADSPEDAAREAQADASDLVWTVSANGVDLGDYDGFTGDLVGRSALGTV